MYLTSELLQRQDRVYQQFTLKHDACVVSLRTIESDCHVLPEVKGHIRAVLLDLFLHLLEELTTEMHPLIHLQQKATRELEDGAVLLNRGSGQLMGHDAIDGRSLLTMVEATLHSLSQKTDALHEMGELARAFVAQEMSFGAEGSCYPVLASFLDTLDALILAMNLSSLASLDVVQALEKSLDGTCQ